VTGCDNKRPHLSGHSDRMITTTMPVCNDSAANAYKHYIGDYFLLGRLPKVDLIILEGGKMSVRTSVRPQKSFFGFNEIWYIGRGR